MIKADEATKDNQGSRPTKEAGEYWAEPSDIGERISTVQVADTLLLIPSDHQWIKQCLQGRAAGTLECDSEVVKRQLCCCLWGCYVSPSCQQLLRVSADYFAKSGAPSLGKHTGALSTPWTIASRSAADASWERALNPNFNKCSRSYMSSSQKGWEGHDSSQGRLSDFRFRRRCITNALKLLKPKRLYINTFDSDMDGYLSHVFTSQRSSYMIFRLMH